MTTLAFDGFPERVDVSGTRGCAMLVGDTLAHFKTQEPFEGDTDVSQTAPADSGENKASDPRALSVDGHLGNVRDFVLAVRDGRPPLVSAQSARPAVALLNMIYEKARVGPYA